MEKLNPLRYIICGVVNICEVIYGKRKSAPSVCGGLSGNSG